jgi:PAS domain S-box-containing protein
MPNTTTSRKQPSANAKRIAATTRAASPLAADAQIGSSEERLRRMATVIQDSNDAITIQDLEGRILAWNRGAEIIYGYSEAEALQKNIVDTVPESHQAEAMNFIAALKLGELVPLLETKRKTKDGRIIDVWLTNTKLVDDQGKLTGVATTGRDITEQTKTLEKFRRMATVIQDSNDAITFQDLDGNILAWNRGAEQIYGYSETEALGMNIVDTVPNEYQAEAREFLSSLKRGELVPTLETKRRTKDGRIVDVWLTNTKLTDDKGKLTGIATTERDISERMGSLEKFRRMATVIEDSNDAITFQDLEGNILAWNQAAEIIYGYSQAEALRMNIVDTVPTEYQEEARGFLASLKRGELLPNLETKRKHKDGRIIDVWLTNTKLTDDKGKLTGIATTERDITERKHAEASIREKARELEFLREGQITLSDKMRGEQDVSRLGQSVLSHLAPFLNAQMGAFYCLTEENSFQRVSGYAYSKLEDKEKTIALGEGLVGQAAFEKRPILIERVPSRYFGKISSDLGSSTPRSLLLAPVFYEGEVNGVIELASFESFSEHQKTFLEHVSENIGIAINTSLSRKRLQELLERSQILTEKLQVQQEELKATNDELEEQSRALQVSQTQLKSQQSQLEQTNEQLEVQAQALEQQRDILNERNEALNKAQTLLEERSAEVQRASQYKSEFLANMSHELRTPLNSSLILAKLLSDNPLGNLIPEQVQYALSIYSAGNDLLSLINDILDLSKVEAGKLEMRPESVFLPKVLNSLERTFDPLAKEKKLKFHIECDAGVPETLVTDRQRMEQILKNLLSNAFKFTAHGQVTLYVSRRSDERLSFSVIDTGIGVPKAQQEVIFEAFRQADGTTNRKYGGTGLGLSISRDLARLLGGTVEVESVPGEGSRFTLLLPAAYDESRIVAASPKAYSSAATTSTAASGSRPAAAPAELVKARIERVRPAPFPDDRADVASPGRTFLVIEDDPLFAKILFDLAHELHYKCVVAQDAEEGCELAQRLLPDGILLDMRLPDHSGLTVLDQLKEDLTTRHIPVQVVSVHDYMEKALQMGAVGYVMKPAKREELKEAFVNIEARLSQRVKRVLIVEDDPTQTESIAKLIVEPDVEITAVALVSEALDALKNITFDCIVIDLQLKSMSGELLKTMAEPHEHTLFPPVIVYTGRALSRDEEDQLRKYSHSIILKEAKSPERLVDEVSLFLHRVESKLSPERRQMLKAARNRTDVFQGRTILVVDDDVRNIFALTAALEQKGATVETARNGKEALAKLKEDSPVDLVLMDVMMPEMDGYQATREIRKQKRSARLAIIAVTAKATRADQVLCMEAGADDYLAKPIDLHQLFALIRIWMPKLRGIEN